MTYRSLGKRPTPSPFQNWITAPGTHTSSACRTTRLMSRYSLVCSSTFQGRANTRRSSPSSCRGVISRWNSARAYSSTCCTSLRSKNMACWTTGGQVQYMPMRSYSCWYSLPRDLRAIVKAWADPGGAAAAALAPAPATPARPRPARSSFWAQLYRTPSAAQKAGRSNPPSASLFGCSAGDQQGWRYRRSSPVQYPQYG